jgi:hypothetical protein
MLNSRRLCLALGAALSSGVFVLGVSTALAGPTVTVRVEGESSTLLPTTSVTLNAPEPVSGCAANSVAAAINLAVKENWDHGEVFGGGSFTDTILGETHSFTNNSDAWSEWVNYKWGGGICSDPLGNGDEVLMVADHTPAPFFAPTVLPLVVTGAPVSVQVGVPFTAQVSAIHTAPEAEAKAGEGTPEPAEGVTVSGTGATTALTDANGVATITLTSPGSVALRATKSGDAPSASFVVSGSSVPQPAGPVLAATPYTGPYAVVAKATGVIEQHVYSRKAAPKVLSGTVLAHTTVASVSLELRRSYKGRCYAFNGVSTRFVKARCGQGSFFKVSNNGVFSYLLPSALAPGRYVLDVEATDAAGNHTTLARGTSRVVFYVR